MKTQVILGIIAIIVGLLLELIPIVGWIYGSLLIVAGVGLIIFRNAEDEIEKIQQKKR